MYSRILLPTDGSDAMASVVDHAARLAAHHGATLHTLYVANTTSLSDLPAEAGWENVTEALYSEGEKAVSAVESRVDGHGVSMESELREGSPAREILGYAEEANCDVVVMGTHGRTGVDRLLLGSVAERVVRSSAVPVLTIGVTEE
jgi:Universal stress protein UspA and related nucleotide-binding proteins